MKSPILQTAFEVKAQGESADVMIYDQIGSGFFEEGVTAKSFAAELKAAGKVKTLNVHINSLGGSVVDGLAIYNSLAKHKARKTVHIDGIAASIASVIAMAGDEIRLAENGFVMIHDPSSIAVGSAEEMRKQADILDKVKASIVGTYAKRTGQSEETLSAMMSEETWLSATEAKELGFADVIGDSVKIAALATIDNFTNVPDEVRRLVASAAEPEIQNEEPLIMADETKVEAPSAVEPATVANVITQADIDNAAKAAADADHARTTEILALCELAGVLNKSRAFIADRTLSVADVRNQLLKERKPVGDAGGSEPAPANDENSPYKAEYAKMKAACPGLKLTEADYIATRRIDDGLDNLTFHAA